MTPALARMKPLLITGAYDGDTIKEFLNYTDFSYREIVALEPDSKNFKKLQRFCRKKAGLEHVLLLNKGIWERRRSIEFCSQRRQTSPLCSLVVGNEVSALIR